MKPSQGLAWLPVVFIIAAVLLGGIVGFAIWQLPSLTNSSNTNAAVVVTNQNANTNTTSGTSGQTASIYTCTQTSDCVLDACHGCATQAWLDTTEAASLGCMFRPTNEDFSLSDYSCSCEKNRCTTLKNSP